MKKIPTREAYGTALLALAEKHHFFVLDSDLAKATKTSLFAAQYPDRFFEMGIAEADMIGTAAGLATCGNTVFASTFAIFAAGRAYDQIRNSVAYTRLNVKIVVTNGGVMTGPDGGSHQSVEDFACIRAIPNMAVLCPSDAPQTEKAIEACIQYDGPIYMRLSKYDTPVIYDDAVSFEIGKGKVVLDGTDVSIIACGDLVYKSMQAADSLRGMGISVRVIDIGTIKPIDTELVLKAAEETGCIVTVEDHNVLGGLGSAVSEVCASMRPTLVIRLGVQDKFGKSGDPDALAAEYGMDAPAIVAAVNNAICLKRIKNEQT